MRGVDVPLTECGSLVVIKTVMDPQRHSLQTLRKTKINRRVENRVAADDQQQLDLTRVDVIDELSHRLELVGWIYNDRIGVGDCVAGVAERLIYLMYQSVNSNGLLISGESKAGGTIVLQITDQHLDPFVGTTSRRDLPDNTFELTGFHSKSMIGECASV